MTKIIFRRDIERNEIVAFFKGCLEYTFLTHYCRIGQHGHSTYDYYISKTVTAKKASMQSY